MEDTGVCTADRLHLGWKLDWTRLIIAYNREWLGQIMLVILPTPLLRTARFHRWSNLDQRLLKEAEESYDSKYCTGCHNHSHPTILSHVRHYLWSSKPHLIACLCAEYNVLHFRCADRFLPLPQAVPIRANWTVHYDWRVCFAFQWPGSWAYRWQERRTTCLRYKFVHVLPYGDLCLDEWYTSEGGPHFHTAYTLIISRMHHHAYSSLCCIRRLRVLLFGLKHGWFWILSQRWVGVRCDLLRPQRRFLWYGRLGPLPPFLLPGHHISFLPLRDFHQLVLGVLTRARQDARLDDMGRYRGRPRRCPPPAESRSVT